MNGASHSVQDWKFTCFLTLLLACVRTDIDKENLPKAIKVLTIQHRSVIRSPQLKHLAIIMHSITHILIEAKSYLAAILTLVSLISTSEKS